MARIAKSLDQLRNQVNAMWPGRDKSSDGWLGDAAHASRASDHNPNAAGVVTAFDVTHDPEHGLDARKLGEALVASRDPRIKYIISNAQIVSSLSSPWVWRPYSGANAHRAHVHVSVTADKADDARPWVIKIPIPTPKPPAPAITGVKWIQNSLNLLVKPKPLLDVDGKYGARTRTAVRRFQTANGLEADGWVGPKTTAAMEAALAKLT